MKIINWFQVPASNIDRATKFYQAILGMSFHRLDNPLGKHAFFAFDTMETLRTGGEIVQDAQHKPSQNGVLIYLNAPEGVDSVLKKVSSAGGAVLMPKTGIGENGWIAVICDTEGNRIGLHSM
jgi:predicted enzyme related to lactoylglutathione lyase